MAADKIIVLMYHRVGAANNAWEQKYCVSPERFAAHMAALAKRGMCAVNIQDFVAWLGGERDLPEGSFVITFDDGFRGVRDHALPVLEQHNWPATVFLVTDLIGRQDEWTKPSNPDGVTYPLLDAEEIRDMAKRGVSFHSHTCTHPSLPTLDDAEMAEELAGSHAALRESFGFDSKFLAYPFGHLNDRVEQAARSAGYRAAFSTQPGFNRRNVNPYRIRRLDVFGTDTPAMLLRKMQFGTNNGSVGDVARYYLSRVASRFRAINS
jgi:peptidoglycan/xylan/chitin deacetylase (PgdA/CDA1 family)